MTVKMFLTSVMCPLEMTRRLYFKKKIHIYFFFEDKTNIGKTLVRKFEETYDAQSIYKGLLHHSKESTQATLDIAELLTYITTVKLHKISFSFYIGATNSGYARLWLTFMTTLQTSLRRLCSKM